MTPKTEPFKLNFILLGRKDLNHYLFVIIFTDFTQTIGN